MDIFDSMPVRAPKRNAPEKGGKKNRARKRLSQGQIRAKIADRMRKNEAPVSQEDAKVEISYKAKALNKKPEKQPEKEHVLASDVQLNAPGDPATTEKLKDLVQNGGFHFSKKERAVLGEILKK